MAKVYLGLSVEADILGEYGDLTARIAAARKRNPRRGKLSRNQAIEDAMRAYLDTLREIAEEAEAEAEGHGRSPDDDSGG